MRATARSNPDWPELEAVNSGFTEMCSGSQRSEAIEGELHSSIEARWRIALFRSLLILLLALAPSHAVAAPGDGAANAAPPNSHDRRFGTGWECDWGYREVGQTCVAIEVPPNAHLASIGSDWNCDRGYRKADRACERIELPPNSIH